LGILYGVYPMTALAFTGFLMSGRLSFWQIIFIWIWAFFWMQISELMKIVQAGIFREGGGQE
jgi:hypothetical protein